MQLHCSLGAFVLGPVEQAGAQIDAGRIQTQQFIFETELLFTDRLTGALLQPRS
jgi:hypothetical protein